MRVIGGAVRGRNLAWESNAITRPITDRVKENIFNVLASSGAEFSRFLDLFAGSGQMGIEAASRGAAEVVFNDQSAAAVAIIKRNLHELKTDAKTVVLNLDWRAAVLCQKLAFDVVFLDPPYSAAGILTESAEFLRARKMLTPGAVVVATSERADLLFPGFDVRRKIYGRCSVYFLTEVTA
jgi:16S rRNA (guanine(966)-N(2))-methyltransferase RsmD